MTLSTRQQEIIEESANQIGIVSMASIAQYLANTANSLRCNIEHGFQDNDSIAQIEFALLHIRALTRPASNEIDKKLESMIFDVERELEAKGISI